MRETRTLHLTLVKKWYDLILCGFKKEEYREIKPYFDCRFIGKSYDEVVFVNGYHKDARRMCLEVVSIKKDYGKPQWGGSETDKDWVIKLGKLKWSQG